MSNPTSTTGSLPEPPFPSSRQDTTGNGRRQAIVCAAGSVAALAIFSWLVFHGGAQDIARGTARLVATLTGGLEDWRKVVRSHPEAFVWVLGLPSLFALCRGLSTRKPHFYRILAVPLSIAYLTLCISLPPAGSAWVGLLFGAALPCCIPIAIYADDVLRALGEV